MRHAVMIGLTVSATLVPSLASVSMSAQTSTSTPCGTALGPTPFPGTNGLTLANGGALVYDANQNVCWLADANLAGNPLVRARVGLSPTNPDGSTPLMQPDGTMDYETALNWVDALNRFNGGQGWLNHHDWQLPTTPETDRTCSSQNVGNFGVSCMHDALANLYNVGLARTYPDSVVPFVVNLVGTLFSLQPGLYWTSDSGDSGEVTFSFNTGQRAENTTKYNYFHVLPMTHDVLGTVLPGKGVLPYIAGPGAWIAVQDTNTGLSWPLVANLAAFDRFGVSGTIAIPYDDGRPALTPPLIDADGAMHFSAIDPLNTTSGWIAGMNARRYAGSYTWSLPAVDDLSQLHDHLGVKAGDPRLEWPFPTGPFSHLQPGFYWACERDQGAGPAAPCNPTLHPGFAPNDPTLPMEYSFNFDDGFMGTDRPDKQFYVIPYFPAR